MQQDQDTTPVYIYALCEPGQPDRVRYIGKTENLKKRYKMHLADATCSSPKSSAAKLEWLRSLIAQNLKPELRVLATVSRENAESNEMDYIAHYTQKESASLFNVRRQYAGQKASRARSPKVDVTFPASPIVWTEPDKREVIYAERMMVRLTPEDNADLKDIATEEQIPVAILARNWITSELKRHRAKRTQAHPADDDTPA